MTTLLLQLLLQAFLIMLNAIFACAEIAVLSANKARISSAAENGDKRAIRLTKLTDNPAGFLATIQVAITLSGFLASAFAADNFATLLVDMALYCGLNISPSILNSVAVITVTLILSYFTLVLGELVPKRIAMKKADGLALGLATPLSFISKLFAPVVWFLSISTNLILRLFNIDPNQKDEEVSEEDIRLIVDTGHQSGSIDSDEQEFIQNVLDFDDITVGEFATHRTDVDYLDIEDSAEKWESVIVETRHSFYPVCEGTLDNLLGILSITDYFCLKDRSIENIRKTVLKQPYFVPSTLGADVLFRQMKKTHSKISVVLDEYGGFFGIVTINDLIEQLVGELEEHPEEETVQCAPDTWEVTGLLSLKEAQEQFGIELPIDEYDTFGGFVFSIYGLIPDDGEVFELETHSLHISVTQIAEHRIEKATVRVIREQTETESEEKGLFRKNKEKSED